MRPWVALFLCLLPATAGESEDCGLQPGATYPVDRKYLLRPDGTAIENWHDCFLPVGSRLSVAIVETTPAMTRVRLDVTPPCHDGAAWTEREVAKARSYFANRGVVGTAVDTVLLPCSWTPRIDAVVTEVR